VRFGLVASFNRPGGNVTGIAFVPNQLGAKRVQLLHDLAPRVARVGLLMNPDNPNVAAEQADSNDGAARLGLQIVVQNARNAAEIDAAFAELVRARVDAVIAATDPVLLDRREQIAAIAERNALPAISFTRQFAMAGLLMSYGPNIGWMYRQAGLHRADPQGGETGRHAGHAVDPLRARPQPHDGKAIGPHRSTDFSCWCRRSDRVTRRSHATCPSSRQQGPTDRQRQDREGAGPDDPAAHV
jgi:hypothetical protein